MESFLGAGDLYIDRLTDAGVSQGSKVAGATSKFALNPESEIKEQTGKGRDNYGQVIAAATLPGKTNIKVTIDQLDAENLALAFLGTVVAGSQAAGTIAAGAPAVLVARHDRYIEIGKEVVSDVVVKDATDTTTFVAGTDYVLNARLGLIKVLSTGAIEDAETIHVSCTFALVNFQKIQGGAAPIIRAKLLLDGKNYVNGRNCKVVVKSARLKPSTEVDFLSDDFLPLELEGVCEIPEGDTTAFDIIYYE